MIKNRDILVVGLQSYDISIGSNSVNLAREFSGQNRVLYVNYAPDRMTMIRGRRKDVIQKRLNIIKGLEPALKQHSENLWVLNPAVVLEPISKVRPGFLFDIINKRNALKFTAEVKNAIRELDFKNFILFNDSDFYRSFYLKELLEPSVFVYYTRDNMIATKFFRRYGEKYESRLMAKADAVVANSEFLRDRAMQYNNNAFYVGQGCDLDFFSTKNVKPKPVDLSNIPSPLIGYVGTLTNSRLDIDLLSQIARRNPSWNIVLVGPEDDHFRNSKLHNLENVHFTGRKDPELLPTYIYYFDVAINPQKLNALTIGNYPRKIDEYLAMGKSVVATKTEALCIFKDHVFLAGNADEFIDKIREAITQNSQEIANKRMLFAQEHSWQNNVQRIYDVISDIESNY